MKKSLIVILALVLVACVALVACTGTANDDTTTTETTTVTTVETTLGTEDTTDGTDNTTEENLEGINTADSVAKTLVANFKTIVTEGTDLTAQSIGDALAQSDVIAAASMAAVAVEEGYLSGFENAEIKGFKEGVMVAPMIGSIPFVAYVFELSEGTDAAEFTKTLEDNANLRWNICVTADEMASTTEGNFVFFVMAPTSFEG